jgi:hypothetical protein
MSRFATFILTATVACSAATPARAQEAPSPRHVASAPAAPATHAVLRPGDRNCLQSTGSLIPAKPGECLPVAGRSYSQEDIRRTGAVNTADALRLLDPSVTVRGH